MYADVVAILQLTSATDLTAEMKNIGIYTGDFLIRFLWRSKFTRNFTYIDDGDTPYEEFNQRAEERAAAEAEAQRARE